VEPDHIQTLIQLSQYLWAQKRWREALRMMDEVERHAPADPAIWGAAGGVRSHANDWRGALDAYERAVELAPDDPQYLYNRATSRRYLGDSPGAEADYDRLIALSPTDYEAYYDRSQLRVQTVARNHVRELEALAASCIAPWLGDVQIRFALAKEYEDLGEYAKSFEQLRIGATRHREHMTYNVASDVAIIDSTISAFPNGPKMEALGATKDAPIFIVGLPRSGTTLVERILSSHSSISSAGELDCLAEVAGAALGGKPATLDFAAIGRDYLARARDALGDGRFIDKMPSNFLHLGLIRRALPAAKIIHVTRHPMALGYAMFKTLFKGAFPFSYNLRETGRYYVAYRRLMQHWHSTMPGAIYDISYEQLVTNQEAQSRKLLAFCDLDWETACAAFHRNPKACATASASQVRRPIYDSSVAQWRHYERELVELQDEIRGAEALSRENNPGRGAELFGEPARYANCRYGR
jgi:Sulfotransferase family/Tetratricopeptide repeat